MKHFEIVPCRAGITKKVRDAFPKVLEFAIRLLRPMRQAVDAS